MPHLILLLLATVLYTGCDPARELLAPSALPHDIARQRGATAFARLLAVQSRRETLLSAHSGGGNSSRLPGQPSTFSMRAPSCDALDDDIDALDRRYDETMARYGAAQLSPSARTALVGELERLTSAVERLDSLYHAQRCPD
ncbi:MAG: hypothetical protein ACR2OG_18210 [Gemmatimonadaceae bacterium]